MLLTAFLKPAKDTLGELLLALGDQAALSLSKLYASAFRARLDSVDEVEERSDPSDFAADLRDRGGGCGGFGESSEGARSRVAGFGSSTMESRALVGARTGRDSCRYRSGNRSVLPSRRGGVALLDPCPPSRRIRSVVLGGIEKGRYVDDAVGQYCGICGDLLVGIATGGCLPVILKRSKSLCTFESLSSS